MAFLDKYQLKLISFAVLISALAFVFSQTFSTFVIYADNWYLLVAGIAAVLFLAFFLLQTVFIKDWGTALWLMGIETVAMTVPLLQRPSAWLPLVPLPLFALLVWAYGRGRREMKKSLEVSFSRLRHRVLVIGVLALTAFLVLGYVSLVKAQKLEVPRETVNILLRSAAPLIEPFLPGFSTENSVGNVLESVSRRVYAEESRDQGTNELRQAFDDLLGTKLSLDQNIVDAVYEVINQNLGSGWLLSLIIGLLFLIGGGIHILSWLAAILGWLIYQLLLVTGFAYITFKDVQQEVVNI